MIRTESLALLEKGYTELDPFPYIVIDNFLTDEAMQKVLAEIQSLNSKDAYYKATHKPNALEYNKYAFNTNLGPAVSELFQQLVSDEFVAKVEALTGIQGIIKNDLSLSGAGVHRIANQGYLAIHTDFNTYKHTSLGKLDRRINILIYMNPEWKEEYKGSLWLCDAREPKKKVLPIINRCVIFNTTSKSFHGHPERLCLPEGISRESIACYYYTKNVNDPLDFEGLPQHESAMIYKNFKYDF
uniref:Prolyl 4-hydroxylase alpha subunit Fe(2+) 2OG dioxygenase domain-containing protein n=1 Tax=viral metagenome TaxID=1070528 RepID=A0A6C0L6Z0_9ZZZZ